MLLTEIISSIAYHSKRDMGTPAKKVQWNRCPMTWSCGLWLLAGQTTSS